MSNEAASRTGPGVPGLQFHDLGRRAASGVVLALVALALTYAGGLAFMGLVLTAVVLMSWEWGRIVRRTQAIDVVCMVHVAAVAGATILATAGQTVFAGLVLAMGAIIILPLAFGASTLLSCLGVFYVGIPAVALITLRLDGPNGLVAVIFVMLVVWTVDTAAFLSGRGIGGPKLWPTISPNKTWAGFLGGIGSGAVVGIVVALWLGAPVLRLAVVALLLGVVSQAGDLAESALKREFGVKDSSGLIPGHGGVLDRLDGVVAAATLAGVIGVLAKIGAPARALLFGT